MLTFFFPFCLAIAFVTGFYVASVVSMLNARQAMQAIERDKEPPK